jgi:hypothetical protein
MIEIRLIKIEIVLLFCTFESVKLGSIFNQIVTWLIYVSEASMGGQDNRDSNASFAKASIIYSWSIYRLFSTQP